MALADHCIPTSAPVSLSLSLPLPCYCCSLPATHGDKYEVTNTLTHTNRDRTASTQTLSVRTQLIVIHDIATSTVRLTCTPTPCHPAAPLLPPVSALACQACLLFSCWVSLCANNFLLDNDLSLSRPSPRFSLSLSPSLFSPFPSSFLQHDLGL